MAAATTSVSGYLTSTDWNTFNNKQAALGFTPIQQGGGTGQGTNKIYIGWASQLFLQVDSTNFGATWPINISGTAAAAAASSINATGASYLAGNAIGSYICTNYGVTPNSLGYTGTWNHYNSTSQSGQNTLYGWIRTA